ncbi:MAG: hypothetical protein ACRDQA_02125 [Nocardioidaceae bacterium]
MRNGSVLGECTAVAGLSFDKVRPLITDDGASVLLGVDGRTAGVKVGADFDLAMAWMHGSYWYQGEYAFAPHATGPK